MGVNTWRKGTAPCESPVVFNFLPEHSPCQRPIGVAKRLKEASNREEPGDAAAGK